MSERDDIARLQGPPIEGAHAIWCTPDNPCAGGLCDGTVERFIRNEGDRPMSFLDEFEFAAQDAVTDGVLGHVLAERRVQHTLWGEQNHPDGTGRPCDVASAESQREACERAFREGWGSWSSILREEVAEAFAETDPERLRAELIQVAAVAVAWVEAIDRRAGDNRG